MSKSRVVVVVVIDVMLDCMFVLHSQPAAVITHAALQLNFCLLTTLAKKNAEFSFFSSFFL